MKQFYLDRDLIALNLHVFVCILNYYVKFLDCQNCLNNFFIYADLNASLFIFRKVFWVLMLIVLFVVRTGIVSSYLTINVLLNNSAEPKLLGSVNGLGMTFASFGRYVCSCNSS